MERGVKVEECGNKNVNESRAGMAWDLKPANLLRSANLLEMNWQRRTGGSEGIKGIKW